MAAEANSQLRSAKDWGDYKKREGIIIGVERVLEAAKSLNYPTEGEKEDARVDGGGTGSKEETGGRRSFFAEEGESYISDLDERARGPSY
jgi:hypothetical protein